MAPTGLDARCRMAADCVVGLESKGRPMHAPLSSSGYGSPVHCAFASTKKSSAAEPWTAARFFALLGELGRLRVISICGPSVFESICEAGPFSIEDGYLNMVTDAFHWHVEVSRFRHMRSHDAVHGRSGRNVLYYDLRERAESTPFLRIYLYRAHGVDFDPQVAAAFGRAHVELEAGVALAGVA